MMSATASSEPRLTVKPSLTPSELDDVSALVREARWNQLAADIREPVLVWLTNINENVFLAFVTPLF